MPSLDALIVTRVLHGGGAERQAMLLAQHLAAEGRRVGVLAFVGEVLPGTSQGVCIIRAEDVEVPGRLRTRGRQLLGRAAGPVAAWSLRFAHRCASRGRAGWAERRLNDLAAGLALRSFADAGRAIRRTVDATGARVVVAFLPSMYGAATAGLWSSSVRLIATDRNDPSQDLVKTHWRTMRHLVARRADVFGANTAAAAEWIHAQHRPDRHPAPVVTPNILEGASPVAPLSPRFLVLSRLTKVKGIDRAIDAFAAVASSLPDWELLIAGDGVERDALGERISSLRLEERCFLLGAVEIGPILAGGGILVHPSAMEGTPNAVMEAMGHGLACIVTDGSPGPVELVVGPTGDDEAPPGGIVVSSEDVPALAAGMLRLAVDAEMRSRLSQGARSRAAQMTWAARREPWLRIVDG